MKICDLGEIQGDMLLFGGVYSNLAALNALIRVAQDSGIPAKNCICTGDVVAYCADAQACVDTIRDFNCPVLVGNCEAQLAMNAQDCGCGFDKGTTCSVLSRDWYDHAVKQVSAANKTWMAGLAERIVFTRNGELYGVVHGAASDISRFIWPVADDAVIAAEIETLIGQVGHVDHVLAGHTGIPMQRKVDGITWVNSGAIGMPCHNGKTTTHYGYLSENEMTIKTLSYDVGQTVRAMQTAGLTQGYHETLQTGYWPSQDNLPQEMH
ncbi:MAG: metallophosphoesterase family protein, partial [Proteobacteria bacterium]|nr:metallophosphoesterase family protein [Pseudomonadota bacterium]